jgi:hypothetical protein
MRDEIKIQLILSEMRTHLFRINWHRYFIVKDALEARKCKIKSIKIRRFVVKWHLLGLTLSQNDVTYKKTK